MSGLRGDETWHTSRGTIRRLSPTSSRMTQSFASENSPVSLEILSRGLFSPVFGRREVFFSFVGFYYQLFQEDNNAF